MLVDGYVTDESGTGVVHSAPAFGEVSVICSHSKIDVFFIYVALKPVDHGHNLRSCKTNPVHLRIPVSRTVWHKQSFIPRGAKLNLI